MGALTNPMIRVTSLQSVCLTVFSTCQRMLFSTLIYISGCSN